MSLADHVRTLGRGPGRSRSLTQDEAADAIGQMLSGTAAPEAVGALLMLLRMKGETAEEIAGMAQAAKANGPELPQVDLDWPSYAAGRTRGAPWFLLSAQLVAKAGYRVLLHGWNGADRKVHAGLSQAGIGIAENASDAGALLDRDGIAYLPLERFHPALFHLLTLRDVLGLRSCVNTVCRMLNPAAATSSVQGVFHPSYRLLQADAAARLGWNNLSVIKGGGGEFERHPGKAIAAFGLRDGRSWEKSLPVRHAQTRRLADPDNPSIWNAASPNAFEEELLLGTAALAFDTLGHLDSEDVARKVWAAHTAALAA